MPRTAENPLDSFVKSLRHQKKTILLIVGVAAITLSLSIIIPILLDTMTHLNFPSIGTIHTIGVEAYGGDMKTSNGTSYLDWGTVYPGLTVNATFYLRSISNVRTTLSLNTTNWNPTNMSNYMPLSWNYSGANINPGEVIPVNLTLSVSSSDAFINYLITNNVTIYSFDITIRALQS